MKQFIKQFNLLLLTQQLNNSTYGVEHEIKSRVRLGLTKQNACMFDTHEGKGCMYRNMYRNYVYVYV
jgi:hypothetical protein